MDVRRGKDVKFAPPGLLGIFNIDKNNMIVQTIDNLFSFFFFFFLLYCALNTWKQKFEYAKQNNNQFFYAPACFFLDKFLQSPMLLNIGENNKICILIKTVDDLVIISSF